MHKYSTSAIIYISLNVLSLLLSTFLIVKLYVSPNHFTKYTQFQLFVASWGYTVGLTPTIINYGDDLMNKAYDTQICIIQQMISLIFLYPLYIFPVILGLYIWHAAENRNIKIEKKYFWIISSLIWCFAVCFNVFSFADGYEKENFGHLYSLALQVQYYGNVGGITRQKEIVGRIISQYVIKSEHPEINKIVIEDYVQPLSGIMLFLIFVKNDSPAAFLPCLYYGGPEKLTFKSESYFKDDRILDVRPPSLNYSFNEALGNVNQTPMVARSTNNQEIDTIEILLS
ncbi:7661_t:CDS:2 [Funneliformis mosseae]|uniref:7661_t:CDS:1 n=1 Tax=Funneliformis mosseae TaxID=27381 RepID=A0A9N9BBV5_FUNMO|nr:7661_t:CDS:2 [Funneliformis mosseae]